MERNHKQAAGPRGLRGFFSWFFDNRGGILRDVFGGLLAAVVLAGVGRLAQIDLSGGKVPLWAAAAGVLTAFVGGATVRRLRRPAPSRLEQAAADGLKLRAYMEQLRGVLGGLGSGLENVEDELLLEPAKLIEEMAGIDVRLAIFEPRRAEEGEAHWHVRYRAGISQRECREFEVPLKDSYLAWIQPQWAPDEVFRLPDLREQFSSTVRAGKDLEAFVGADFRVLKCVRIEQPEPVRVGAWLVLLSKEKIPFNGIEDSYLVFLSHLLSIHFQLTGMTERLEALERKLGDEGV